MNDLRKRLDAERLWLEDATSIAANRSANVGLNDKQLAYCLGFLEAVTLRAARELRTIAHDLEAAVEGGAS